MASVAGRDGGAGIGIGDWRALTGMAVWLCTAVASDTKDGASTPPRPTSSLSGDVGSGDEHMGNTSSVIKVVFLLACGWRGRPREYTKLEALSSRGW